MAFQFNVLVVGDTNVGKTTFINRLSTGEYNREHVDHPQTVTNFDYETNVGTVELTVYELSSSGIEDVSLPHIHAIMIMYSLPDTSSNSISNTIH